MSKVGNYEILDELSVTPHGSVSRARRADGEPGVFAVKRFVVAVDDDSEPHWELQTFLDRARVQQTLAAGGARHWAPIHDLGIDVDSAWYVTDYLPLTAQKLIDGGVAVKANGLYAIVLGVLHALSELKALRNRSHGNLTPRNILIGGQQLATAPIFLTDPATNGQAGKLGEAADVRAIGELIHALVLHRVPPAGQWQIPASPEWNGLGSAGAGWRRLCGDLLNPEPTGRLTLPLLAQRLYALRAKPKFRLRKVLVAAIVIGMLGTAALGVLSTLDHTARSQFCQARHNWFGRFIDAAADSNRRKKWDHDADLQRILSQIPVDAVRAIDCNTDRLIRWKYDEFQDVRNANLTVQTVQTELPAHWKKAARAAELRKRFEGRGWTQPAEYLAGLLDGATPAPGVDLPAGIDRLLAMSPSVESGLKLADSDWQQFTDRLATIEQMHDPVLTALARVLRQSASSDVRLTDAGFSGLDEIKRDAVLAGQLADAIRETWPTNVDREPFDRAVAKAIDVKHARREDVGTWLNLVQYHAFRRQEAVAAGAQLRKRLQDTIDLINRAHVAANEKSAFESAKGEAGFAISEFEQMPFTRRSLDDGSFSRKRDEVQNRIESLRRFYHPEGPQEWLAALPAVATGSDRINKYWESWRKVLSDGMPDMLRDHAVFAARQQASEQMRALLVSMDQTFPPAPPMPNDAFMATARARREQSIARLLPMIDLRDPKLDPDAMKSATEDFIQWTTNLVALSKDFPITRELLNAGDHPDEVWKTKKPEFWNEPAVQALVKDDVARLNRINALASAPRQELVKTMSTGGAAEVALEAWRLLGSDSVKPPWPTKSDELTAEFKFRQRLAASFKALHDPSEADAPARDLAEQAPIRWRRFVENATSEAMLKNAWNLHDAFAVDDKQLAKLAPAARYDLDLEILHEAIGGGEEKEIRQALSNLSGDAASMKNRPAMGELAARIALVDAPEPFADRAPGDTFAITLPGATQPVQFKRVEPAEGRPFYLCTTDVSMGQFAGALDATHAWPQAKLLPWPYESGKADSRRGPRTWEWGGTAASPMTAPLLWLSPEEYNDYPQAFRAGRFNRMALSDQVGGNPSADHPIQYISAPVALFYAGVCGCRLPTPAEWQAAYHAYEKAVPADRWNLRDQTWETQRRYVASGGGSRWPDEGSFPSGSSLSAVGRTATSRPQNDGALFFQPINGSGGTVFHHLVGNVAQFVCEASDPFDRLMEKKTAAAIRTFIEANPKSVYVIGGSALSAPELPIDKPLPVTHLDEAYADVGIRLAFTAPSRTLAEKVKWAIGTPAFVWPESKPRE